MVEWLCLIKDVYIVLGIRVYLPHGRDNRF